jgi:hypothetical protein
MPEAGGPTTQSGILYQNSIAALFLGRLCDATSRPEYDKVIRVRVETPDDVDDLVVTFSDSHKLFIQAKENVNIGDVAWKKLWVDFGTQFLGGNFIKDKDRLALWIGNNRKEFINLREICERSISSKSDIEWLSGCNTAQVKLLEKIKGIIHPELLQESALLHFFQHIVIEIHPSQNLERDEITLWMPATNFPTIILFKLFRDKVGEASKIRGEFTSNSLQNQLMSENSKLIFSKPPDIEELRTSIRSCSSLLRQHKSTVGNTGIHISRKIAKDIVQWAEDSSDDKKNVAMLIDQAGTGKTVVVHDVQCELEVKGVDVFAIKADQQLSGISQIGDINSRLNLSQSPEIILDRLAQLGRVVVLIDQIDALSLSLAHNQATLDVVLDLVARLRQIPNIRIIISCRLFDRNNDQRLKQIDIPQEFKLAQLTDDEVISFLDSIGISFQDLPESTQTLLKTPLHLNLFALALDNESTRRENLLGVTSLQELYGAIWNDILLQEDPQAPSKTDRLEVIRLFTNYMAKNQVINVPKNLILRPEMKHLERAIGWLASAGIIVESNNNWVFIHQTFFDYCFARDFVEQGKNLVDVILQSDQGLFIRPLLIQVITFMRGTNSNQYINNLSTLLFSNNIRYHLQDLLLNWFGSLVLPTDDEWVIAQRMLITAEKRMRILQSMWGNSDWFLRLRSTLLPNWLGEEVISNSLLFYLVSVAELSETQLEICNLLRPYLYKSEDWNTRLEWIVTRIRKWHSYEAVDFYSQIIFHISTIDQIIIYQISEVSMDFPKSGISLLRHMLDLSLNQINNNGSLRSSSFIYDSFHILENHNLGVTFRAVSKVEPKLFLEAMLPWLEKALSLREIPESPSHDYFFWDQFSMNWYDEHESIKHVLVFSIIDALITISEADAAYFMNIVDQLSQSPFSTPQRILVRVFQALSATYASEALSFLLADRRRLELGDIDAYDSRQLIKAIYPNLSDQDRDQLEEFVLQPPPINKEEGIRGLNYRGIEQLHLLQSIPQEYLSKKALKQLVEWEHKFPGSRPVTDPITIRSGWVGPPISDEIAKIMTDRQWIKALQKYHANVRHKDFLKGGSLELSRILQTLVKEDPERYFALLQRVNDDVDDDYVQAFLNGFTESSAPIEFLLYTIRRFSKDPNRRIKRTIAWDIEKRAKEEIPDDIIYILYNYLRAAPGEDEKWWSKEEHNENVYSSFLNSDRGAAFSALMRIYDGQKTEEANNKKWSLIEFIESDPSTALHIGAIHELTYMIRLDRDKATQSFMKLINNHEILYESMYTREFIYWNLYKNFIEMYRYIVTLMNHSKHDVQEQGAQLACIAGLSTGAMESENALRIASNLAEQTIISSAPTFWKHGAAVIYSHNVAGDLKDLCIQKLITLLNEEDAQIHDSISRVFYSFQFDQFSDLKEFICIYAQKTRSCEHRFSEYLLPIGILDPEWTLEVVRLYINNPFPDQSLRHMVFENIIRLVLRIYVDPTVSEDIRKTSMDLFDILIKKYPDFSQKILSEWDKR